MNLQYHSSSIILCHIPALANITNIVDPLTLTYWVMPECHFSKLLRNMARYDSTHSDTLIIVEQAWGAAAKHSTRRTTSVKKCVNSI
jgi:glucose-6-phosphate 1-dehydrogenase